VSGAPTPAGDSPAADDLPTDDRPPVGGPRARARLLADGMTARITAHGALTAKIDGDETRLLDGRTVVASFEAGEGAVLVDLDPRAGVGDPARMKRLGRPHPDPALSREGWRRIEVKNRADGARVVNALRPPKEKTTGEIDYRLVKRIADGEAVVGPIRLRRLRAPPSPDDGVRVFVDGAWPRGVDPKDVPHDAWVPEVAPSPIVLRAYGPTAARDAAFRRAYLSELRGSAKAEAVSRLRAMRRKGRLTLLTDLREVTHGHAAILARALSQSKTPTV
jgi:uncharacterized protein YeaO (DUF488 family)